MNTLEDIAKMGGWKPKDNHDGEYSLVQGQDVQILERWANSLSVQGDRIQLPNIQTLLF